MLRAYNFASHEALLLLAPQRLGEAAHHRERRVERSRRCEAQRR
jgi:hypothetical protein